MRLRYGFVLCSLLLAGPAFAQGSMNLSWNDCGTSGLDLETFACNTNAGAHRLVTSFVSPVPMNQLVGADLKIDVAFQGNVVPDWWNAPFSGGGCRVGLGIETNPALGPQTCGDPWNQALAGGANIQLNTPSPGRARLQGIVAVPSSSPQTIDNVTEYYGIQILISNAKSTGSGSCEGCAIPACLMLVDFGLYQPLGVGDYHITQAKDNVVVGWQCNAVNGAPTPQCFLCPVPTKPSTWGSVKSLYR